MKLQRWLAIGLSAVLSVSACLPVTVTGTYASETGSTQEMTAEEAVGTAVPGSEAAEAEDAMAAEDAGNTTQEAAEETGSNTAAVADPDEAGDPAEDAEPAGTDAEPADTDGEQEAASRDEILEDAAEADTGEAEADRIRNPETSGSAGTDDGKERDTEEALSDDPSVESGKDVEAERGEADGTQNTATGGDRDDASAGGRTGEAQAEEKSGRETVETPAVQASEDDFTNAVELTEGSPVQVEVTADAPRAYLKFTPVEDSGYAIYSLSEEHCDTYGTVYDESYEQITSDDDSGEDNHFYIKNNWEAGHTYYIECVSTIMQVLSLRFM